MRKTRKVRVELDLVIELDEPVDSIPFGAEWCNNAAEAVVRELAKVNPTLDGKGKLHSSDFNMRLDFRK